MPINSASLEMAIVCRWDRKHVDPHLYTLATTIKEYLHQIIKITIPSVTTPSFLNINHPITQYSSIKKQAIRQHATILSILFIHLLMRTYNICLERCLLIKFLLRKNKQKNLHLYSPLFLYKAVTWKHRIGKGLE
jgi:hypothetical protein